MGAADAAWGTRAGQGGMLLKDMGCMLWKAGDAGEGLAAEAGKTYFVQADRAMTQLVLMGQLGGMWERKKGRRARKHGKGGGEKVFFLFANKSAKGKLGEGDHDKNSKKRERKIVPYWADQKSEVPAPYRTVRDRVAWHSVGYQFRVNVPPQRLAATPANLESMGIKGEGLKDLGVCERGESLVWSSRKRHLQASPPPCRLPSRRFSFFWFQKKLMG